MARQEVSDVVKRIGVTYAHYFNKKYERMISTAVSDGGIDLLDIIFVKCLQNSDILFNFAPEMLWS